MLMLTFIQRMCHYEEESVITLVPDLKTEESNTVSLLNPSIN
jgi:hypothetical protein